MGSRRSAKVTPGTLLRLWTEDALNGTIRSISDLPSTSLTMPFVKDGRPVAVRVFAGNTGGPKTFPEAVDAVRGTFGLTQMIMVGDRGMITSARIADLRKLEGMAWITCLRGPAIKKLMAGDGPLQLSVFDEQDLAEITSPDFPDTPDHHVDTKDSPGIRERPPQHPAQLPHQT